MVFVIALFIVGVVAVWLALEPDNFPMYVLGGMLAVCLGLVLAVGGFGLAALIGKALPSEYVLDKQIELVAIDDTVGLHGRFYLGTGTIESKSYYVFYQKAGSGFKSGKISAEETTVYEEERNDGFIKAYERRFIQGWYNAFGATWGKRYDIFIPQGTIKRKFNMDLK